MLLDNISKDVIYAHFVLIGTSTEAAHPDELVFYYNDHNKPVFKRNTWVQKMNNPDVNTLWDLMFIHKENLEKYWDLLEMKTVTEPEQLEFDLDY